MIVGARRGGSTLALALAERGWDVLLVDAVTFPSPTVSTHVLWPNTLARLDQLGVLDALRAKHEVPLLGWLWSAWGTSAPGSSRRSTALTGGGAAARRPRQGLRRSGALGRRGGQVRPAGGRPDGLRHGRRPGRRRRARERREDLREVGVRRRRSRLDHRPQDRSPEGAPAQRRAGLSSSVTGGASPTTATGPWTSARTGCSAAGRARTASISWWPPQGQSSREVRRKSASRGISATSGGFRRRSHRRSSRAPRWSVI